MPLIGTLVVSLCSCQLLCLDGSTVNMAIVIVVTKLDYYY